MKSLIGIVLFVLLAAVAVAQEQTTVRGHVRERTPGGPGASIVGASVYWLGTTIGTLTDTSGHFMLPVSPRTRRLVVSSVGYAPDTLTIAGTSHVAVMLEPVAKQVADVEVVAERNATTIDYMNPRSMQISTEKELFKAACCNLSESFETNPSIDVSFTDAVTGTRQIEMLGLAGTYSQITTESMPAIRGLTSNAGLTYLPGTWIHSIQVSKGTGSVANGYESITGQINVELRKSFDSTERNLFVNAYGNQDLRTEANLNLRQQLTTDLSSLTLLHYDAQRTRVDANDDRFLDIPLSRNLNFLHRMHLNTGAGFEGQFSLSYLTDEKDGGTDRGASLDRPGLDAAPSEYRFRMRSRQVRLAGKTGFVFPSEHHQSIGLQWSYSEYRQGALLGHREYAGQEQTGYLNLLYDDVLTDNHHLRAGLSYVRDVYDETMDGARYQRTEHVPGAFVEYTFTDEDVFSAIAGLRVDNHNMFGVFVTPRLHVRYAPDEDWVFRGVAGRGQRTANIFAENIASFASARRIIVPGNGTTYPFRPEVGWNYGVNLTHYFLWDYREATISIDYYRTSFENQVVADLDTDPRSVTFSNLQGSSFSNSIQAELNLKPVENLDIRAAYRYLDVQQSVGGVLRERPLVARHRAFINMGYTTPRDDQEEPFMQYDFTVQWFGPKRVPDTKLNPAAFRVPDRSPGFFLVNAQVTRSFFPGLDLYLGVENLFDFRQEDAIVDPAHPHGIYFDSAMIWGPVSGRMVYSGIRWRV